MSAKFMPGAEGLMLLLADSRLPTGAHTQSAGVEPALLAGLALKQVPEFVRARLGTVTLVEGGAAVIARNLWLEGRRTELLQLNNEWMARTIAAPLREASFLLSRGYLRLGAKMFPELQYFLGTPAPWSRGIVFGAMAAAAGLDAERTARLVAYDEVQTIIAAALKLQPFDPADGALWSLSLMPDIEAVVAHCAPLLEVSELPAHTAPLMEHWAQDHSQRERRLFRA